MKTNWTIGDVMRFEGRKETIYGVIVSKAKRNTRLFRILWFDDGQTSEEDEHSEYSRVTKVA